MTSTRHTIDANGQILGRLAVRVADILQGKDKPDFDPSIVDPAHVTVINTDRIRVSGKNKPLQKLYRHHSGYPGGLKEESLEHVLGRDSRLAVRRAVTGMLPKNRLRPRMLKNLTLYKGTAASSAPKT
jgi:large subunit ribosomal protein L13